MSKCVRVVMHARVLDRKSLATATQCDCATHLVCAAFAVTKAQPERQRRGKSPRGHLSTPPTHTTCTHRYRARQRDASRLSAETQEVGATRAGEYRENTQEVRGYRQLLEGNEVAYSRRKCGPATAAQQNERYAAGESVVCCKTVPFRTA